MRKTSAQSLAKKIGVSQAKAAESVLKAKLITAISKSLDKEGLTHAELSKLSGVPRTAITGILSGSLQKVTIDRILKMLSALNLEVDVRVKKIAS